MNPQVLSWRVWDMHTYYFPFSCKFCLGLADDVFILYTPFSALFSWLESRGLFLCTVKGQSDRKLVGLGWRGEGSGRICQWECGSGLQCVTMHLLWRSLCLRMLLLVIHVSLNHLHVHGVCSCLLFQCFISRSMHRSISFQHCLYVCHTLWMCLTLSCESACFVTECVSLCSILYNVWINEYLTCHSANIIMLEFL